MGATRRGGGRCVAAPANSPVAGQHAVWDGSAQQWVYTNYGEQNAIATADQAITANTTLTNSTYLTLPLLAGFYYDFEAIGFLTFGGTAPGYKLGITGPGVPVPININIEIYQNSLFQNLISRAYTAATNTPGNAVDKFWRISGTLLCPSNGNLVVQFAQNVSDAAAVTLKIGSRLKVTKLT